VVYFLNVSTEKRLLILGKEKWFLSLGKISPNLQEIFTHFYSTQGNISLFLGKSLIQVNYFKCCEQKISPDIR
jgi:hypothetical protein